MAKAIMPGMPQCFDDLIFSRFGICLSETVAIIFIVVEVLLAFAIIYLLYRKFR